MMKIGKMFIAIILLAVSAARANSPVTAKKHDAAIVLNNGLIQLTFSGATGQVTSLKKIDGGQSRELGSGRETTYWDCNTEPAEIPQGLTPPKKGYWRPSRPLVELIENTPDRAEVKLTAPHDAWCLFDVELRYTLLRGDSGFYTCAYVRHPPNLGAATFWQTRFVAKLATDADTFDTHIVDDRHVVPILKGEVVEELMDATVRLADGSVKTKYANSVCWADAPVFGIAGSKSGLGVWNMTASHESTNGGPLKQGQTVHDNVLLRVMQSVHFGASPVVVKAGEEWSKVYGPFFTYVNGGGGSGGASVADMWTDAKRRQRDEAARWPYQWVTLDAYGKRRGTVTGHWKLTSRPASAGALVILASPGEDWARQSGGYQFWTRTGPDGAFTIKNVLPGRYTLFISGADQPDDFTRDGVEVVADRATDVGTIDWTPRTGVGVGARTLWQIGTFDRSAGEFRNGDDARNYEMFRRYPQQFPEDVTFTIGTSDPSRDWNYAHWIWYSRRPVWTIRFDLKDAKTPSGQATLTIGVASAQPVRARETNVQVKLNDTPIGAIRLPKTGTAGYRGGVQDSQYNVRRFTFDTSLLRDGPNELTLAHADAIPFPKEGEKVEMIVGQLMYDALRLEVPR